MNRYSRKSTAGPRRYYYSKPGVKIKESNIIKVLHSPQQTHSNINPPTTSVKFKKKEVANRSCYVTPNIQEFGQNYTGGISPKYSKEGHVKQRSDRDKCDNMRTTNHHYDDEVKNEEVQYEDFYEPGISTITQLKELKKRSCDLRNKAITTLQHASQTSDNTCKFMALSSGSCWQKVDSSDDVDEILSGTATGIECSSKHVFISEMPLVKVIAEKFSKFKQGSLEVRRLDEKVVCVEYDIFTRSKNDKVLKLAQKMRAFFSIKPLDNDSSKKQKLPRIPSNIKNEFEVIDENFEKLTDKEIEFIDDMIEENKSYLEDLKRILKRTQSIKAQKNKNSLDLQSLYEMAKRDRPPLHCDYSGVNLLSKAELQEVKDLILQRCTSSVHGFRRTKIKQNKKSLSPDIGVISESIMAELLAITKTLNV